MKYKTIDLCAGIGGIRRGFEMSGKYSNVLSAEIDRAACETYKHLFGEDPQNDLTTEEFKEKVSNTEYDVLLAGFPCQAFSSAGLKLGFRDATRGTIFFDLADIISRTNPRAVFLENVENLYSHDKGKTLKTIISTLEGELGYRVIGVSLDENGEYEYTRKSFIRNSRNFGVPQNRPRMYIMAFSKKMYGIRSIHAHCRAALEKAVAEKLIRQNPAIGCKLPPKKTPEVKILTPEAMQKLLYQAQIEGFYEMFMLDLATGLRRGEIVGLQWKDIDFETGTLSVTKQVRYVKKELVIEPPKTKASERTIILSPPVLEMLTEYRKMVNSIWLFPSPVKEEDVPRDPSACRKALARILKHAGCEHVPFHAMRHTFASNAFHYGMDVKTLASTIGHESVETTLNVYAHSSEQMKRDAARKIDEAIGTVLGADVIDSDASCGDGNGTAEEPVDGADQPKTTVFEPYKGKKRKPGTGYVKQLSANCWQGRYTPTVNGKRIARNVYAPTEDECEVKLAELIKEMKAEFGIK